MKRLCLSSSVASYDESKATPADGFRYLRRDGDGGGKRNEWREPVRRYNGRAPGSEITRYLFTSPTHTHVGLFIFEHGFSPEVVQIVCYLKFAT